MSTKASKNPDSNPNPNPNAQPSQAAPSSLPNPSIDLGYAAAQRKYETPIGPASNRKDRAAKLVPLRVKSVATADSEFIPLASTHSLAGYHVVGVTWRPVKEEKISLPSVEMKTGLEFQHKTIQAFGVVLTNAGQIVLLPANGLEQPLPSGFDLVGTIPAPKGTYLLRVHDRVTDEEMYTLGIVFPNTVQPDWVELAKDRRERVLAEQEEERREREAERGAEMEEVERAKKEKLEREASRAKPVQTFATSDKEVIYQMQEAYAARYLRRIEVSRSGPDQPYLVEDPENFGPAIAERVAAKREELGPGAESYFERERDRAEETRRSQV
jgi:hypothetical protein